MFSIIPPRTNFNLAHIIAGDGKHTVAVIVCQLFSVTDSKRAVALIRCVRLSDMCMYKTIYR